MTSQQKLDIFVAEYLEIVDSTELVADYDSPKDSWGYYRKKTVPCVRFKLRDIWDRANTRAEAIRKAVHSELMTSAKFAHAETLEAERQKDVRHYHRMLSLAWLYPLSMTEALDYEELRPIPERAQPRIPIPWKAPKQAIAWGMDPQLVAEAKARHLAVIEIEEKCRKTPKQLLGNWQYRGLGQDSSEYEINHWLKLACIILRKHGLGRLLGDYEGLEDLFETP